MSSKLVPTAVVPAAEELGIEGARVFAAMHYPGTTRKHLKGGVRIMCNNKRPFTRKLPPVGK